MPGNMDIFTWFPRREDYEKAPQVQPDETLEEKIGRLNETIESNQTNIKEIVDGDSVSLEEKIYRTMDIIQDIDDLSKLLSVCEKTKDSDKYQDQLKKARVGLMNLKAYLSQVDIIEFSTALRNEFQFKMGCEQKFGPWLDWAEKQVCSTTEKPTSFEHCRECEQKACQFLKTVVKANKGLKLVQAACDGIRGSVQAQETMAKLQERYYVLCKKSEQRVKNIQHLLVEWKRMEDILEPPEPKDWDDFTPKQILTFLKTYAMYYA